jgi:hypothetical protein
MATFPQQAAAQSPNWAFDVKTLFVGELSNHYTAGGFKQHVGGCDGLEYPAWWRYTCNQTGQARWFAVKDFTDEKGTEFDRRISKGGYYSTGRGEMFPGPMESISWIDPPTVFVDGLQSFQFPIVYDEVDESIDGAGQLTTVTDTEVGITLKRRVIGFNNEYHDNYHIIEYTYTNTGELTEERGTLPEQTLEDVYFAQVRNYEVNETGSSIAGNGGGWGRNMLNDVVGDDLKEYNTDFRAQYTWLAYEPGFSEWNSIGGPAITDNFYTVFEGDTVGRLSSAQFAGFVTLHADQSAIDNTNDPDQPSVMGYISNGHGALTSKPGSEEQARTDYEILEGGGFQGRGGYGSHADRIVGDPVATPETPQEWRQRMAGQTQDPGVDIEGFNNFTAYGPYTLAPGESVRIVVAEGVAGLGWEARVAIGSEYKAAWRDGDENRPISYDADGDGQIDPDETMSKNEWVLTSRDSLFAMFERARANYESDYSIPRPPKPPGEVIVSSGPDRITLEWSSYAGESPAGFEIYRTARRPEGDYTGYELVAGIDELGPNATRFEDETVQRGVSYFYYIQSVGEVNNDPTGMTPTGVRLRSSRAYTQTYDPAFLRREPGENLESTRVVPNPFTITADSEVRWPDQRDKIGFLDIPGDCTISIYTETGELVESIRHDDGSGDEYWNLTTSSEQLVVSGIYWAVIQDHQTGDQVVKRFVIIR